MKTPLLAAALALLAACPRQTDEDEEPAPAPVHPSPPETTSAAATADAPSAPSPPKLPALRRHSAARAKETVAVHGGVVIVGSTPGDEGRDPTLEPYLEPVTVRAFSIDALPYPNEPATPPKTNVTRIEAEALCAERGAHLCDEVEWEAACKGPAGDRYPTGAAWDSACAGDGESCASGYGARAMGTLREWTASASSGAPIVRGAGPADPARGAQRCARRRTTGEVRAKDLGFRCCKREGAAPDAIAGPKPRPAFAPAPLAPEELARIFQESVALHALGEPRLFDAAAAASVKPRSAPDGVVFAAGPLLFGPEPGAELVVVAGHTPSGGFVVALYPRKEGGATVAASLVLKGDESPLTFFYRPSERRLGFTSCWMCPGRQGFLEANEEHEPRFVLRER